MRGRTTASIAIFDDVKENLYELASIVDELGYTAKPVLTVAQARKVLAMGENTLLLLDIAMPEMSGFEFLRRIRQEKQWEEIPVIFISAYFDQETKEKAFELGAFDYIVRPFDRKECGYRIRQAAEQAKKLRQLQRQREDLQQMMAYRIEETKQAKKQVVEALLLLVDEPCRGYFKWLRDSVGHFVKGLSVIPEFEHSIHDRFIEEVQVAAPLYLLGKRQELRWKLHHLYASDHKNEYLAMGIEIAENYGISYEEAGERLPISAQIVGLVAWYDSLTGTVRECMEVMKREEGGRYHPMLIRAFHIIQLPYYLDKEAEEEVSY